MPAWELMWLGTWVKHDFFLWLIMVNWNYKIKPGKAEVGRNLLDNRLEKNRRNHKLDFNVKREHSPHSWEIDNYMCQIHTVRKEYNCWLSNLYDSSTVKKTSDSWQVMVSLISRMHQWLYSHMTSARKTFLCKNRLEHSWEHITGQNMNPFSYSTK